MDFRHLRIAHNKWPSQNAINSLLNYVEYLIKASRHQYARLGNHRYIQFMHYTCHMKLWSYLVDRSVTGKRTSPTLLCRLSGRKVLLLVASHTVGGAVCQKTRTSRSLPNETPILVASKLWCCLIHGARKNVFATNFTFARIWKPTGLQEMKNRGWRETAGCDVIENLQDIVVAIDSVRASIRLMGAWRKKNDKRQPLQLAADFP